MDSVDILGVRVTTRSLSEVAAEIIRSAAKSDCGSSTHICATSVHGLIESNRDPAFRTILNQAMFVTPDGMPLVWFGKLRGRARMTRVYGPALMKEVCRLGVTAGIRHFF